MSLVLDASATLALVYSELKPERAATLEAVLREATAYVPQLWHLEVANVLLSGLRRGGYTLETLKRLVVQLAAIQAVVDEQTPNRAWYAVLDLAVKHTLTSYDAAYLELAQRLRLPLATLDKALVRAAQAEAVPLFWN